MTLFATSPDGVRIAYETFGEGEPILLIHGFASNRQVNWRDTGWYAYLTARGHRVIALDCRGHGESDKPHEVSDYEENKMLNDVVAVLDAVGVEAADVMGYSMGGYITLRVVQDAPARARRFILGGVGRSYFRDWEARTRAIADALVSDDPEALTDPTERLFRRFAESSGNDLVALSACMRRKRRIYSCEELHAVTHEALLVCGSADDISGPPDELAKCMPNARVAIVPNRDHMRTVGDQKYKDAVGLFLGL